MIVDRPYQAEAPLAIRALWAQGKRAVLLRLATGGGKTHIFSRMMIRAAEKGMNCVMLVRGVQLVEQAHQRLMRENVPHGVRQGNHWNKNYQAKIQICSVDTIRRRIATEGYPEAKLLVIDEAHLMTSKEDRKLITHYKEQGCFILAVSATPYVRESLRHLADEVITPISMRELIDQGYLAPFRYFCPSAPDLRGLKTRDGDWVGEELEERMRLLTGSIVEHWFKHARDLPTLGFASSIAHAELLATQCRAAGINSDFVTGDHALSERDAAVQKIRNGGILWNVGTMNTGVDIPWLRCLVLARPTKSYPLFVQQCGRGTRIFPGKENCIILDHAGNILRHGFPTDEPDVDLNGRKQTEAVHQPKLCPTCYIPFEEECPECGFRVISVSKEELVPEEDVGVLKEIQDLPAAVEISIFIRRMKVVALKKGYKKGWIYHKVKEKYGEQVARTAFPNQHRAVSWFHGGS